MGQQECERYCFGAPLQLDTGAVRCCSVLGAREHVTSCWLLSLSHKSGVIRLTTSLASLFCYSAAICQSGRALFLRRALVSCKSIPQIHVLLRFYGTSVSTGRTLILRILSIVLLPTLCLRGLSCYEVERSATTGRLTLLTSCSFLPEALYNCCPKPSDRLFPLSCSCS